MASNSNNEIQYNLLRSLSKIPPESIGGVINFIKTVSSSSSKLTNICNVLLVAYLTWEAYESIKQWWNGEISGKRCAKQIVDSVTSVLAGTGVGIIGGMIGGGLLGPVGMAVGSIVGGIAGTQLANSLSDWLTLKLFDLPKDKSVENAFIYMNLSHHASNQEINTRFRELCLQYHPDKGGNAEDFHKLQAAMAIIRLSKGL